MKSIVMADSAQHSIGPLDEVMPGPGRHDSLPGGIGPVHEFSADQDADGGTAVLGRARFAGGEVGD